MHIDTAGTYTLQYTAVDSCGNETIEERTVEVIVITYRTVLYTDGTLIINEKSTDIDANVALHGAATNVYVPMDENNPYVFHTIDEALWDSVRANIYHIEIGSDIVPTSINFWFRECVNALDITKLNKIDTSQLITLSGAFYKCEKITGVDISTWDTSNVESMATMFGTCTALQSIDLTALDTSAVTNMFSMFNGCASLTSVNVNGIDVSHVTNMNSMFFGCTSLESLDLSSFVTSSLDRMTQMLRNCSALKTITFGQGFDTSNVTLMGSVFEACRSLETLDITMFDTSSATIASAMFRDCDSIEVLDISSFSGLTDGGAVSNMFANCKALKIIYVSNGFSFNSQSITPFLNMSTNLVGGAGTVWDASRTGPEYGHVDGGTSNPGYFTVKP